MLQNSRAFSSFSVNDIIKAKEFYAGTLALPVRETKEGLEILLPGGGKVFAYAKEDHTPATYTVLNFEVADINHTVDELRQVGVQFEQYDGDMQTDEKGIAHGSKIGAGPDIAWFKDPAGNFLAIMEQMKS